MCGIFGIWGRKENDAATLCSLAEINQNHRGEDGAGVAVMSDGKITVHKGDGLVSTVLTPEATRAIGGYAAIAHNRYTTYGGVNNENIQPFYANCGKGEVAVAHNGQFENYEEMKRELEDEGCIFRSTSDTELILHYYAISHAPDLIERVRASFVNVKPSYSALILTKEGIAAIRDPNGYRPLVIGKLDNAFVFASETAAFDVIGAKYLGEVKPGELVIANDSGLRRKQVFEPAEERRCIFEYIYFARPDSYLGHDFTVSEVRKAMGEELCRVHPACGADYISSIPDSGNAAATGYSRASGITKDDGFIRNHYIGRTFILPELRDYKVRLKLNPDRSVVKGRKGVFVEDSIVRGNTTTEKVNVLRGLGGASEIHIRIASPPINDVCIRGISIPTREELIANRMNIEDIKGLVGADSLGYLPLEEMLNIPMLKGIGWCTDCFDKEYKG